MREARAAARLSHPNVVAVFDQGDDDGVVYLAMELVEGRTLRDTIAAESPMRPDRALALVEPVLSALASAHRAGLVHRDVKPENVLIGDDGRIKVADFGLAKAVSADTQHTGTQGVLIGTVSYLAPELVVEGRSDARADVYAAGVVLYELLTGAKPHEGESPIQVAYKHVHTDVPAPSRRVPGLPGYVDALIARATARDPDQRPADAAVLLHQVHRVAQALAEGVAEDEELALDLRPVAPRPEPDPVASVRPGGGTSPEIFDAAEIGALVASTGAAAEPTTTWGRGGPSVTPSDAFAGGVSAPDDTGEAVSPPAPVGPHGRGAPGRPRRRRGALLLGLALVVALSGVGGAYWFGWARYTSTPGVIGLAAATAGDRLTSAGLRMDVADEVYSETVPAGRVLRTDPAAGSRVLPGGTVDAVVSLGKERYDVPDVAGRTVDDAQDALTGLSLRPDETLERFSETVAEGTVIRTRPGVGTTLRPGSPVDLVVSKGRRPVRVGRWVGKDYDDAAAALEERGLSPSCRAGEFDDTVPEGAVVSQDPARGTAFRGRGGHPRGLRRAPRWWRCPGSWPTAWTPPRRSWRARASRCAPSRTTPTSASASWSAPTPVAARWPRRARSSRSSWSDGSGGASLGAPRAGPGYSGRSSSARPVVSRPAWTTEVSTDAA